MFVIAVGRYASFPLHKRRFQKAVRRGEVGGLRTKHLDVYMRGGSAPAPRDAGIDGWHLGGGIRRGTLGRTAQGLDAPDVVHAPFAALMVDSRDKQVKDAFVDE